MLVQLLATEPDQLRKTCGGCRPDRCFNHSARVVARMRKMPTVVVTRDNWWQLVDICRSTWQNDNVDELAALMHYGICARSLITEQSAELLQLWKRTGGIQVRTPAEFYQLPAKWVHAVMIIEETMAKIRAVRNG